MVVAEWSTAALHGAGSIPRRNKYFHGLQVVVLGLSVYVIFYVYKRTHDTWIIPRVFNFYLKKRKLLYPIYDFDKLQEKIKKWVHTHERQYDGGWHVCQEDDAETVHNRQRNGAFRVVRFFASGGNDVESNKSVETSRRSTEYLVDKEIGFSDIFLNLIYKKKHLQSGNR